MHRAGWISSKEKVEGSIVLDGQQSRWFKVENGLRQGCPLSPLLYSIYVMEMVEKLEEESLGVKDGDYWCGALLYAACMRTGRASGRTAEECTSGEDERKAEECRQGRQNG